MTTKPFPLFELASNYTIKLHDLKERTSPLPIEVTERDADNVLVTRQTTLEEAIDVLDSVFVPEEP